MAKEETKNYVRSKIYTNGNHEVSAQNTVEALDKMIDDSDKVEQQVATLGSKVGELDRKNSNITTENTESEEDSIVITTDAGVQVGKIDENGADFNGLKNHGKEVLTEHQDISQLATKEEVNKKQDGLIAGENITISADGKTISAKGGVGDLPITKESATSVEDSIEFVNESGKPIMRITPERVMVEEITDMEGNPIGASSRLSGKKIMIFGGSVSALLKQYQEDKTIEELLGVTVYDMGVPGAGFFNNMSVVDGIVSYKGANIQRQVDENTTSSSTRCDIYIFWASTNDYVLIYDDVSLIGEPIDYTAEDNFNINKRLNQSGGLNYCIKKIQDFNPSAKIVILGSLKCFGSSGTYYIKDRESLDGKFKKMVNGQELCAKRFSLPFFSLWENSGINEYNCYYYMYHGEGDAVYSTPTMDGVHPNKIAYRMLANKISQFLMSI